MTGRDRELPVLLRLCELQCDVELGDDCFTCMGELDFSSWREKGCNKLCNALFVFVLSILWGGGGGGGEGGRKREGGKDGEGGS